MLLGRRPWRFSIALSGVYMSISFESRDTYPCTYLEALADANPLDTPEIVGPVRLELNGR